MIMFHFVSPSYHQKYLLQQHPWLMNQLDIDPGPELINSHGKFVKIKIFKLKRMLIVCLF